MSIDFDELRGRLQASLERLERGGGEGEVQELLRRRSRQFAALRLEDTTREALDEVIVVRRADSLLAFPIRSTLEVRDVVSARLPHRSQHICGLFQLRGQVYCLVDLQPFVGPATELAHGERGLAVLVQGDRGILGIRIDEVLGPRTVHVDELDTGRRDRRLDFVTNVTRDCVELIDVEALFASPELQMTGAR